MVFTRVRTFFKHHTAALGLALIIFLISLLFFVQFREWAQEKNQIIFGTQVSMAKSAMERRLKYYITTLKAGKGFIYSADTVTRSEWRTFIASMDIQEDYPGIQGIGYAVSVNSQNLAQFEQRVAAEGFPEFEVSPSGQRSQYFPILYLEPFDWRNRRAFGYDMFTNPVRRKAMEKARDLNQATMSGKVKLVQETEEDVQPGFLIYLPIYRDTSSIATIEERRKNIIGFVYSPFRAENLIHGTLKNHLRKLDIEIYDGRNATEQDILYSSDKVLDFFNKNNQSEFQSIQYIKIAGHTWTFFVSSKDGYAPSPAEDFSYFILASGLVISALVFSALYFMSNARTAEAEAKQQAEENERRLQRIFEEVPALVALVKVPEDRYILINPVYRKHAAAGDLNGKSIEDGYLHLQEKDLQEILNEVKVSGKSIAIKEVSLKSVTKNKDTVHFNLIAQPIFENTATVEFILIFAVEVTELINSRKELSEKNDELESKNQELIRINNDLDNFIYTASHDLKAPISNIEGLIYAFQNDTPMSTQDTAEFLRLMNASVERLKNTIQDLSEITKAQKGIDEQIEIINLHDLTQEVIEDNYNFIKETGATIKSDFSQAETLKFSKKNLRSIIYNLLSNALKYKGPDRKPEISLYTETTPEFVVLTVKDNGLGISEKNREKIFYMFRRLHDHVEGTGVGLYIVKRIVDNAGGKIEVESEEGRGATFKIYFKKDN